MDFVALNPLSAPAGQRYLFHYTDRWSAEQIAEDESCQVRWRGRYGYGMYATDIVPDEEYRDEVELRCFDGDPPELLDGVVVLVDSEGDPQFVEVDGSIFLKECDGPYDDPDLTGMVVAWGCFTEEGWRFTLQEY